MAWEMLEKMRKQLKTTDSLGINQAIFYKKAWLFASEL